MNEPPQPAGRRKKGDDKPPSITLSLLMAALCVTGGVYPLCSMADDFILHFTGVVAKRGDCRISRFQGTRNSYTDLDVSYVAADGSQHDATSSLWFVIWPRDPDDSVPCEVRYSPGFPSRFSTTWGFGRLPSRLVAYVLFESWLLLFGLFCAWQTLALIWGRLRPRRP